VSQKLRGPTGGKSQKVYPHLKSGLFWWLYVRISGSLEQENEKYKKNGGEMRTVGERGTIGTLWVREKGALNVKDIN